MERRRPSLKEKVKNDSKKTKYPSRRIRENDHPEHKKWKFLRFINGNLEINLRHFSLPITGYEFENESVGEIESYIVNEFDNWLDYAQENGKELRRLLELHKNVKKWLKKHVKDWNEIYQDAKLAPALSNEAIVLEQEQLSKIALALVSDGHHDALYEALGEDIGEIIHDIQMVSQDYRLKRLRNQAIEARQKELDETKKFLDSLKSKQGKPWPPKWTQTNKIKRNMEKKGNRHFYSIYKWLKDNKMKLSISSQLAERKGWDEEAILVQANLDTITKATGIPKNAVFCHLKEMRKWGMIHKMGKLHDKGSATYVLGKWSRQGRVPKPGFWFTQKAYEKALKTYNAYRKFN